MFKRTEIITFKVCNRRLSQHSMTPCESFIRASCLIGMFVFIGILTSISVPLKVEAAEVCHINLKGNEFDDNEVDDAEFDFSGFYSMYQDICMPRVEEEGTVSRVSQIFRSQGFFSILDLPIFDDSGIASTFFEPCDILFDGQFSFDEGVGRALVICPSEETPSVDLSVNTLTIEEGSWETYTIVLTSDPDGTVTVTPSSNNPDVTVSGGLSFDSNNWDTPQTVTVSAPPDDDIINDGATLTHSVSGYGNLTNGGTVAVTVIDDYSIKVTFGSDSYEFTEGVEQVAFHLVAESTRRPPDEFFVSVSSGAYQVSGEGVATAPEDYGALSQVIQFSPDDFDFDAVSGFFQARLEVPLYIIDDDISEPTEHFLLIMEITPGLRRYVRVSADRPDITIIDNDPTPTVTLRVDAVSVDENDSATTVTVTAALVGSIREMDTSVTVSVSGGTASSDDFATISDFTLTIPAGQNSGTETFILTPFDDSLAEGDETVSVTGTTDVPGVSVAGTSVTINDNDSAGVDLSVSTLTIGEDGTGTYTVELTGNPDRPVTVEVSSNNPDVTVSSVGSSPSLSINLTFTDGNAPQEVTVHAAPDGDGDNDTAELTHSVTGLGDLTDGGTVAVTVSEPPIEVVSENERTTVIDTVATVAAATVSNVTTNIGARFSAARTGTSLSLAGHSIAQTDMFDGAPWSSFWNTENRSRTLGLNDFLRSTEFQIALGANEGTQGQEAAQWTVWGRGDLQSFSSDPDRGSGYEGDLRAGYLGLDMQLDDRWLTGVAVSQTTAEADYSLGTGGANDNGRMNVSLTSLLPYVRFAPDSKSELWAILGVGQGEIENDRPDATVARETSDVRLWMAAAGGRRAMDVSGPLDWALLGDMGLGRVETEDGVQAIAGLTVDVWQVRLGVEGSFTAELESGAILTPFMEVAGRYDGGDGRQETGVELSPGMSFSDPGNGFGLEVRGRALVFHSAENYEEYGLSATASLSPRSDGLGLSLSLTPRWGENAAGADTLWREDGFGQQASRSNDGTAMSLDTRLGYGLKAMNGVLTPFGELGLREQDSRQMRIGARFNRNHSDPGALSLELSGEWRENQGGDTEQRVGVIGRMRF